MLTVKQAAERLGVSATLVYALCAQGKIIHERYGLGRGTIRISEDALGQYRVSCQVTAPHRTHAPAGKNGGAFSVLDPDRLLDAWRKQGVLAGTTPPPVRRGEG